MLLAGALAGAFAVRAVLPARSTAVSGLLGLCATLTLAAGLVVATEGTMDAARILGLLALLVGSVAFAAGVTVLAQGIGDRDRW
ncbi:MAG: hypothetical protein ABW039_02850 [Sphingobium sp.]